MLTWEPYTAGFTGTLKSFITRAGRQFTLDGSGPRVVQGQPFMVQIDDETGKVRFVQVHMPRLWEGRRR